MKKLAMLFLVMFSFILAGCGQNSKIDGMKITYERISYEDKENYGVIEGNDIILYVVASSGSYTPSVKDLDLEDGILEVDVELSAKGNMVTCDMALWKITIDSTEKYVSGVNSINVEVEIVKYSGGMYLIRYPGKSAGYKVRESRLYKTEAEAKQNIRK